MGSRRPRKAEQCSGKQRHPDRAAAEAHVFALARAGGMLKRLRVYLCRFCGCWHVGHKPKPRRQR